MPDNEYNDIEQTNNDILASQSNTLGITGSDYPEYLIIPDNDTGEEINSCKKNNSNKKNKLLITFAAIMALIVSLGGVNVFSTSTINVNIISLTSNSTSIVYDLTVDNLQNDPTLVLYNDFITREIPITNNRISGVFEDLKPSTKYTLAVKYKSGLIKTSAYSQKIFTTSQ